MTRIYSGRNQYQTIFLHLSTGGEEWMGMPQEMPQEVGHFFLVLFYIKAKEFDLHIP